MGVKTADLLLAMMTYPAIPNAILYVELMATSNMQGEDALGSASGDPSAWEMLMSADPPIPPRDLAECLRGHVREEMALGTQGRWEEVLREMGHPSFMTFLRGKMGAL